MDPGADLRTQDRKAAETWQLPSASQGFLVALSRQLLGMGANILSSRMQRNKCWSFSPASGRTEILASAGVQRTLTQVLWYLP